MTRDTRPTLDTVASAAGVSRTTVSNAYNRPDQLSTRLRERVLRAADELGYAGPHPLARGLATRRSATVAMLLPSGLWKAFSDPALLVVMDALAAALDAHGHGLVLLPGADGALHPDRLRRSAADVGIAYGLPDDSPAITAAHHRGLQLVVIDSPLGGDWPTVCVDDQAGAEAAARHLLALGHRRLGVLSFETRPDGVNGPLDRAREATATYRVTQDRLAGFRHGLSAAGGTATVAAIWETSANRADLGRAGADWLLSQTPRPTALFCLSDELALGALTAAHLRGLTVPADLSIAGFDDIPAAGRSEPALTTVHQPLTEKGQAAAELALRLLNENPPPDSVRLPTRLVVRSTTGRMPD